MSTVYDRISASAQRVIERFTPNGNNATWYKSAKTIPDPDKPWRKIHSLPSETPFRIIFIESRDRVEEFNLTDILDETELKFDGTFGIFHPQGFDPEPLNDYLIKTDGANLTCRFVRKYAPENQTLLYIVGLR